MTTAAVVTVEDWVERVIETAVEDGRQPSLTDALIKIVELGATCMLGQLIEQSGPSDIIIYARQHEWRDGACDLALGLLGFNRILAARGEPTVPSS